MNPTTFILIVFLKSGYGGGATSVEFNSLETCEAAKAEIVIKFDTFSRGVEAWCFEK